MKTSEEDFTEVCESCGKEYQPWGYDNGYCEPCHTAELEEL